MKSSREADFHDVAIDDAHTPIQSIFLCSVWVTNLVLSIVINIVPSYILTMLAITRKMSEKRQQEGQQDYG